MNYDVIVNNKSFVLSEKHLDIVSDKCQYDGNTKLFDLHIIQTTNRKENFDTFLNFIERAG